MTITARARRFTLVSAVIAAAGALSIVPGEAHKAITSKYTYNDDVFPILRDQLGPVIEKTLLVAITFAF